MTFCDSNTNMVIKILQNWVHDLETFKCNEKKELATTVLFIQLKIELEYIYIHKIHFPLHM